MRYRRRSCLHAGKRGQVQCRPFFTTFLLPRSIYLVPLAVLVLRLFAHFSYPLFISVLFSLCLADLLASSRVCCGSLSSCVHAGLEKSWRDDRYLDRATTAESVHWPLFFGSSLVTVRENFYVIKTSSADRNGAMVK